MATIARDLHTKKRIGREEVRKGFTAVWRQAQPFRLQLGALLLFSFVSALANGSVPYITGRFFDALISLSHGASVSEAGLPLWGVLLGLWALVQLVASNVDWLIDRLRRRVNIQLQFAVQVEGFVHFLRLPMSYHKSTRINGELQKVSQASWRMANIVQTIVNLAPQVLSLLIGIALAASINRTLAGVLLIGVAVYAALLTRILFPIAEIDSAAHQAWNDGWDDAAAAVQQVESVKQAAAEEYQVARIKAALLERAFGLWYRLERTWSNIGFFQRTIVFLTQLAVFVLSVRMVMAGTLTVGGLLALNGYANMFFGPFVSLGYSWQVLQNGLTAAAAADEIFLENEEEYAPRDAVAPERIQGDVAFERVSFRYGADGKNILQDLDFSVRPGQVVALVGPSGVGKSTAVSLMSGYYFPTEGRVLVDGVETNKYDLHRLRSAIAVVPQEVALFNDSIKENIRYGSFNATDDDVRRVAAEVRLAEFIETLPRGYDTNVGERGVRLSVGQKQRIAIARAMLRDPSILILDEPTSALDARTERLITESLGKLMQGRTTFIVAHRLSTVREAHVILVFDQGTVIERGTHDELMALDGGAYQRLYNYHIGLH